MSPNHRESISATSTVTGLNEYLTSTGGALNVNASFGGSVAISSVIPGTGATNLGKAEDSIHTSGDVGVFDLAVANVAQATLAADGDYIGRSADLKGNTMVVGNQSAATADAGAPVKTGGVVNNTPATYTDGQRGDTQLDTRGNTKITLMALNTSSGLPLVATNADNQIVGSASTRLEVVNRNYVFNGTGFDRMPGTTTGINVLPYPATATVITSASGNVANATAAATLAGAASKTTYITGFVCSSSGSTAGSAVTVTVTGTISGTLSFTFVAPTGALTAAAPLNVQFASPIPASTTNTAIVVSMPALGTGNTNATTVATGYQL